MSREVNILSPASALTLALATFLTLVIPSTALMAEEVPAKVSPAHEGQATGDTADVISGYDRFRLKSTIEKFYNDDLVLPSRLYFDAEAEELYVLDSAWKEVFVFDLDNTPVFRFGSHGEFENPIDAVSVGGRIYVTEFQVPLVKIFNYRGKRIGELILAEDVEFSPGMMDIDKDGNIYVINRAAGNVVVFTCDGAFKGVIGEKLPSLAGVAVGDEYVYLITPFYKGKAIHAYLKSGKYSFGFEALEGQGGRLGLPASAKVDGDGDLWVMDSLKGVLVYSPTGELKALYGGGGASSRDRVLFGLDIDFGPENVIYITDKMKNRVSIFK